MEVESLESAKMLHLAAERIDKIFWFGILEDLDRSLELLSYQLGLEEKVRNFLFLYTGDYNTQQLLG